MQEKPVVGKLPFVSFLQFLPLLLPKPVSDGEFGACKTKTASVSTVVTVCGYKFRFGGVTLKERLVLLVQQ